MRKKRTPGRKRKRSNRNSADLENDDKPQQKRADTGMEQTVVTPINGMDPEETHPQGRKERSPNEIYDLLLKISDNQNALKQSLEQRISDLEQSLRNDISDKIGTLRSEIEIEFAHVDTQMDQLKQKISAVEEQTETLRNASQQPSASQNPKLVFKNIKLENDTEKTENGLKNCVNEILKSIGLDFSAKSVEYIGSQETNRQREKVPLMVKLETEENRSEILRNKRKLKEVEKFKNVYIETDKSRHERIQEANIRHIIRSLPNLQLKGGRVMNK